MQCILLIFTPTSPFSHSQIPLTYLFLLTRFPYCFKILIIHWLQFVLLGVGAMHWNVGMGCFPSSCWSVVPPKCRLGYCSWLPTRGWYETPLLKRPWTSVTVDGKLELLLTEKFPLYRLVLRVLKDVQASGGREPPQSYPPVNGSNYRHLKLGPWGQ